MKKYFKLLGVALLATSLCFAMTSCNKDTEDDETEQGGGGNPGGGGSTSMTVNFDGQSWSPESSGYNYAYYVENNGNPYIVFRVFSKIEGTSGTFPALQMRFWAQNADGEQNNGIGQFFNNYATNPGHIRENYLQSTDGSQQFTVYDYTFAPSVQGSLVITNFNYNASTMKVGFSANIGMIEPSKYWGDNDGDGNADNVIDAKNCSVTVSNMQLTNPPSSKAMIDNAFATSDVVAK